MALVMEGCIDGVGWLPDSSGFVFTAEDGRLVHFDVKSRKERVLVADTDSNTFWPAVSPDGKRIAVARLNYPGQQGALQILNYDLSGKEILRSKKFPWGVPPEPSYWSTAMSTPEAERSDSTT